MCAHWQSEYDASPCSYCVADQENAERVQARIVALEQKIERMTSLAQNFDEIRSALAASTKLLHDYNYAAALAQGRVNRALLEKFPPR